MFGKKVKHNHILFDGVYKGIYFIIDEDGIVKTYGGARPTIDNITTLIEYMIDDIEEGKYPKCKKDIEIKQLKEKLKETEARLAESEENLSKAINKNIRKFEKAIGEACECYGLYPMFLKKDSETGELTIMG